MRDLLPGWMRPAQGNTATFLWVALALGFVSLLAAGIGAYSAFTQIRTHTAWIVHTYEVVGATAEAATALERAEAARRGYLIDPDGSYLDRYREASGRIPAALDRADLLTEDNPEQQQRIATLRTLVAELAAEHRVSIALAGSGRRDQALALFSQRTNNQRIRDIRIELTALAADERVLLEGRETQLNGVLSRFYIIVAIAAVLFLFVVVVTLVTLLRYTRDLAETRDAVQRANASLEDTVIERTGELRRANDEIQRFAYIVSHDLRSPLVNVMGFTAELEAGTQALATLVDRAEADAPAILTDDAREAARTDLPEAIGFIRTSTAKMDRLIGAILKLSREGRRTIAPEGLDMHALVDSIRATLQHRLDEQHAEIAVEGALPRITSDRVAIDQIFSNVIENAVKYRHPDRPGRIVVRGRTNGGQAVFEIEDNGRGIEPRDHGRVFDLFRRSGAQDQPGEGIGLAHVRALTYRLGGTIDVRSTLGEGSTFVITLPIRYSETAGAPA